MTPRPHRLLALLALAVLPLAAAAAPVAIEIENPSFTPDDMGNLLGWQAIGHASGKSHEYAADREKPRSAPASARIKRTGHEPWGLLAQVVTVKKEWVGRQVRLTGYLRTAGATGTGGALVLQATNGSGSVMVHDHMDDRRARGDQGWKLATTQIRIPAGSYFVKVGVMLEDDGTLWADDLKLELLD
jgi:hypothetical protein